MKVAIVNDTRLGAATTGGLHFGCQLVMETIDQELHKQSCTIVQRIGSHESSFKIDPSVDLVIVNGEGSLHHNRRRELIAVAKEAPAVLINTVWQANDIDGVEHFKYVCARESLSARELHCDVVPDLLFGNSWLWDFPQQKRNPVRGLLATDSVMNQGNTSYYSAINPASNIIPALLNYKQVVTGRFHIAAACAVLGIPFSCYPSNTHKIEGMLIDMGIPHRYHLTSQEAIVHCPLDLPESVVQYAKEARTKVENLFIRIVRL